MTHRAFLSYTRAAGVKPRVLVTSAGSGAASNLMQGLRRGGDVSVTGCHHDPFVLMASAADRSFLTVAPDHPRYGVSLSRVVREAAIDLVVPVGESELTAISRSRRRFRGCLLLPSHATLLRCQDKLGLARHLRRQGVPTPKSYAVSDLRSLGAFFRGRLRHGRVWCRARQGAGSVAAAPISSAREARAWIELWGAARNLDPSDFMIAEYLPGRDYACQSLWSDGRLIVVKTTERLAYVDGASRLSGTSSVAALHKTVRDERVATVAAMAVLAVDRRATGAFSVDLREDGDGRPCVTEINAGRLLSGTTIFDQAGTCNMSFAYLQLGLGRAVDVGEVYDATTEHYVVRDLDMPPRVFQRTELWATWFDARNW